MSRSMLYLAGVAFIAAGGTVACGVYTRSAAPASVVAVPATVDRMTVRTAEQDVVVDSPTVAGRQVERMVLEAGGYLERSSGGSTGNVRVDGRVPAAQLDSIMDRVAGLGKERRRHLTGVEVTDQYNDLSARLHSNIALRDRLKELLSRATTIDDVLKLEKEIARLQADIDSLQARIDQLASRAQYASLAVTLERKRVLGPLAAAGNGAMKLVGKLFVIR